MQTNFNEHLPWSHRLETGPAECAERLNGQGRGYDNYNENDNDNDNDNDKINVNVNDNDNDNAGDDPLVPQDMALGAEMTYPLPNTFLALALALGLALCLKEPVICMMAIPKFSWWHLSPWLSPESLGSPSLGPSLTGWAGFVGGLSASHWMNGPIVFYNGSFIQ